MTGLSFSFVFWFNIFIFACFVTGGTFGLLFLLQHILMPRKRNGAESVEGEAKTVSRRRIALFLSLVLCYIVVSLPWLILLGGASFETARYMFLPYFYFLIFACYIVCGYALFGFGFRKTLLLTATVVLFIAATLTQTIVFCAVVAGL